MQATLPKLTPDQQLELERCQANICYFITDYGWIFDPRPEAVEHHIKFRLYPFQEHYIRWLEERYRASEDGFVEKSRDMGATWGGLWWLIGHWLWDEGFHALIGSRKEELVDKRGEPAALFSKLEYGVNRLPTWMQPAGWNPDKHHRHLSLVNPANGNVISGESANADFSRQGRYSCILMDELGFWPWARAGWGATADSTRCRIAVTTASPGSYAKELRFSGRINVLTLLWKSHPEKDAAWRAKEEIRRPPEDLAREVDINWEGAIRGLVYGEEWAAIPKGSFPYVPGWPLFTSWDFGLDGTPLIWWQRNPASGKYRAIDFYSNAGRTIDFYVPWCTGSIKSGLPYAYSEQDIAQIESHAGWPGATHYGDPDVAKRNLETGRSTRQILAAENIHVQCRPDRNDFGTRWQETKLFLRRVEGINLPACAALDDAMTNARFPERPEGSQSTGEKVLPIHDWSSHARTAVEYMAVNVPPVSAGVVPARAQRRKAAWESL